MHVQHFMAAAMQKSCRYKCACVHQANLLPFTSTSHLQRFASMQNTIRPCDKTCIKHMKKAISVAIPFVTVLYILVASLGYITTASFILTELVHNSPHWMLDLALIMLLLSAVGIYQVSELKRPTAAPAAPPQGCI